jgi:hypothetical protein
MGKSKGGINLFESYIASGMATQNTSAGTTTIIIVIITIIIVVVIR